VSSSLRRRRRVVVACVFCVVVVASSSSSRRRRRRRNPPSGDDDDDDAVTLPSIARDRSIVGACATFAGRATGDRCIAWMILRAIYMHVYTPRARARRARTTPEQSRAGEEFTPTRDIPRVTRMPRLERDRDRAHHAHHAHRRKTLTHTYARYISRSPLHRLPSSRRPPSRCPPRRSRPPSSSVATTASSGSSYVSRGDAFGDDDSFRGVIYYIMSCANDV